MECEWKWQVVGACVFLLTAGWVAQCGAWGIQSCTEATWIPETLWKSVSTNLRLPPSPLLQEIHYCVKLGSEMCFSVLPALIMLFSTYFWEAVSNYSSSLRLLFFS